MRLLKRSLPLILAVPLVLGTTGTAFAEQEDHCARGGGGQECQGGTDNQGEGLPGIGPGIL
jgi:hypothetical protein